MKVRPGQAKVPACLWTSPDSGLHQNRRAKRSKGTCESWKEVRSHGDRVNREVQRREKQPHMRTATPCGTGIQQRSRWRNREHQAFTSRIRVIISLGQREGFRVCQGCFVCKHSQGPVVTGDTALNHHMCGGAPATVRSHAEIGSQGGAPGIPSFLLRKGPGL